MEGPFDAQAVQVGPLVEGVRGDRGEVEGLPMPQALLAAGQSEQRLDQPLLVPPRGQHAFQDGAQ